MTGLIKPDLNKPVFKLSLFKDKADRIRQGLCPECEREIKEEEFNTELDKKEYSISGLCQTCQNLIFNPVQAS